MAGTDPALKGCHDWFYPQRLGGLCCRNCGLWHGAWAGDPCPGKLERWEFGPSGQAWARDTWKPADIVRGLAAGDPVILSPDGMIRCTLCEAEPVQPTPFPEGGAWAPDVEHIDCPWRLAQAWLAAHPDEVR